MWTSRGGRVGSSPLARGTPQEHLVCVRTSRLIPARAGNTESGLARYISPPAHPRSRGEHVSLWTSRDGRVGSSPLARGTLEVIEGAPVDIRLIPARAGNTPIIVGADLRNPAHPRSRGEHSAPRMLVYNHDGSSPLARGTPKLLASIRSRARLIPARAGNTPLTSCGLHSSTAHPRSRGEHT